MVNSSPSLAFIDKSRSQNLTSTVLDLVLHCSPSYILCSLAGILDELVVILYWKVTFLVTLLTKQVTTTPV